MCTVALCGLALIHWERFEFIKGAIQGGGIGFLWTALEIVIFAGLVWALVSSRANERMSEAHRADQRLRARQKELTLK
jgi:hypothetical protein